MYTSGELWMKVRVLLVLINCKQLFRVIWSHLATEPDSTRIMLLQIRDGLHQRTIPITIQKEFCYVRSPTVNTQCNQYRQSKNTKKSLIVLVISFTSCFKEEYCSTLRAKANTSMSPCGCARYIALKFPLNKTLQPRRFRWTKTKHSLF